MRRLIVLLTLLLSPGPDAQVQETSVQLPAPAMWLAAGEDQVYAVTSHAQLLGIRDGQVRALAHDFARHFVTACAGRAVGINDAGQLQVWTGKAVERAAARDLSPLALPLCLSSGIVAVSRSGELVRFEAASDGWQETARQAAGLLPDAQLTLADLTGTGHGQIVALTRPDAQRSDHGILGDRTEATELTVFERHTLGVLARLTLPAPYVFEDLQARPLRWQENRDVVAVVRSSPGGGGALVLVEGNAEELTLRAAGPDFGQPHRWLAPVVGYGQLWAVQTPHIGGRLTRYEEDNGTLRPTVVSEGVSNHSIGSRNLDAAVLVAPGQPVVPSQDHRRLLWLECPAACSVRQELPLNGVFTSNLLHFSGQIWVGDQAGTLHRWAGR
ncbi:hypothetical protein [Deinococcus aerophilus]|uniref:Uncharacterized protein n=1 Tax=Deinococcus aerophilus TaxID=522488 RepID=A0ABQ2GYT3_9DEIO|nr:hypothetical protein [Deinococcus aerophilus]GGM20598.1 hypothetical protein GCM10010841_30730 [Deinococcus aerophilus]